MRRISLMRVLLAMTVLIPMGGTVSAQTPPEGSFSCRASLVRVGPNAEGNFLEPRVANDPATPCVADDDSIVPPTAAGPLLGTVAGEASTYEFPGGGAAFSSVVQVGILPPPGVAGVVGAFVGPATTYAIVDCSSGAPEFEGIAAASIVVVPPGIVVFAPPNNAHTHRTILGVGTLHLNHIQTTIGPESGMMLARAVWLETIGSAKASTGDVVVSESIAGYTGNPCP